MRRVSAGCLNMRWWMTRGNKVWQTCAHSRTGICATRSLPCQVWRSVASVGGFVKEYQVDLDPAALAAHGIALNVVADRIRASNGDVGGKIFEAATVEYYVRGRGYIKSVKDIEDIVLLKVENGTPVYVKNVGKVHLGSDLRRGVVDLDGKGETVGGIIVMRYGENALRVIDGVKKKLAEVQQSLQSGVRVVPVYDRSDLILRAVGHAAGEAAGGVRGGGAGVPRLLPVACAVARSWRSSRCRLRSCSPFCRCRRCISRVTSCPWAVLRLPLERWWMRRSSWWKTRTRDWSILLTSMGGTRPARSDSR